MQRSTLNRNHELLSQLTIIDRRANFLDETLAARRDHPSVKFRPYSCFRDLFLHSFQLVFDGGESGSSAACPPVNDRLKRDSVKDVVFK